MSLSSKFKKNLQVLAQTVDGTVSLDFQNPKLYKKILRYYEDQGVEFYDDPYDTYEYVIDLLKEDLDEEIFIFHIIMKDMVHNKRYGSMDPWICCWSCC